jgi:hypothetical protein
MGKSTRGSPYGRRHYFAFDAKRRKYERTPEQLANGYHFVRRERAERVPMKLLPKSLSVKACHTRDGLEPCSSVFIPFRAGTFAGTFALDGLRHWNVMPPMVQSLPKQLADTLRKNDIQILVGLSLCRRGAPAGACQVSVSFLRSCIKSEANDLPTRINSECSHQKQGRTSGNEGVKLQMILRAAARGNAPRLPQPVRQALPGIRQSHLEQAE